MPESLLELILKLSIILMVIGAIVTDRAWIKWIAVVVLLVDAGHAIYSYYRKLNASAEKAP